MKQNIKLLIMFILGIMISLIMSVSAATTILASEVSYTSNSNTTVQGGIDNYYSNTNTLASNVTALNNDFNTGIIKIVQVWGTIGVNYASNTSITASTQSGYTFVSWVQCHTSGWTEAVYAESPLSATTNLWVATRGHLGNSGTGDVVCEALYKKNL